jgi:two-component system, LytTR family, response regulator
MNRITNFDKAAYLKASESYCIIILPCGKAIVESRPMKYFEKPLLNIGWCRIHKSYLVNPFYVQNISTDRDGIYLQNGTLLPISRRKRKEVLEWRNVNF